ncbi:Na(+)/H(+) antiporter subunit B [Pseudothermotoga thermarum]|uniref:Na+/H+ antiporter MnhB subunit-related protein n=1 Tax=Pseudothermotoga thermarum DSM 5069 TaxID=688269 RepID=F7YTZ9_9THEM|nr:Na(+)/H(+) antiporter subunit B [Pseudothermotoga thermarum]AEH51581.1 Na+/H+ antiporter MnhB subunit-related protein [Pseudothermotoga thermarum DSM 5069]
MKRLVHITVLTACAVLLSFFVHSLTGLDVEERVSIWYFKAAFNPENRYESCMSPQTVASIVWDFRGIDTFFETATLFFSLVGILVLFKEEKIGSGEQCDSIYAQTGLKITFLLMLVMSFSLTIFGHISPGGGFQGGTLAATAVLVLVVGYSLEFLVKEKGITLDKFIYLRMFGLTGIFVVSLLPLIGRIFGKGGYIFQNLAKSQENFGFPATLLGMHISGSIFLYNLFEFLAVLGGFSLVTIILSHVELDRGE